MARTRAQRESALQRTHGHCADVLMDDFGVPKAMRERVCEEIAKVWVQISLIHSLIIWSVRGYQPRPETQILEAFLRQYATHEQKNRKPETRQGATYQDTEEW